MNRDKKILAPHRQKNHSSCFPILFRGLGRDIRFAFRMLMKNKGFAATALVTLALCIGANIVIFSMLHALVLKPLPYPDSNRIVIITNRWPKSFMKETWAGLKQYLDFKEHTEALSNVGCELILESTVGVGSESVRLRGLRATAETFDILGLKPMLGRFFSLENSKPENNRVVVLAQSYWESKFQKDPGVLGRTMRINGDPYEIIGVAPRALEALDVRMRFAIPIIATHETVAQAYRYAGGAFLLGRIKSDATRGAAQAQMMALEKQFYDTAPADVRKNLDASGFFIGIKSLQDERTGDLQPPLYMLQGGVLFVLLIGCVNIANLLLARSNARQGEMAIRMALGAERKIIGRQLLIESLLLTWLGAGLGLFAAWNALAAVNHFTTLLLPDRLPFAIDLPILVFAVLVATLTALLIGLFPILHMLGSNLFALIQSQSRRASSGRGIRAMSGALVITQIAVTLILLIGAGLLIRSFAGVLAVDPGFNPRKLVAARVILTPEYTRENRHLRFPQQLLDGLHNVSGFESASVSTNTPYQTLHFASPVTIRDYKPQPGTPPPTTYALGVSHSYLETMRIPLIEGRWFTEAEILENRLVCVVDKDFARRFFADRSAIGGRVNVSFAPLRSDEYPEIIGVVANARHSGPEEKTHQPYLYFPLPRLQGETFSVLIRSSRSNADTIAMAQEKVKMLDPGLPALQADSMENIILVSFGFRRFIMLLLCSFAGIAVLLAAIGIYGVLAYDVSQRTHEIGIRGAIGATSRQITRMILRQGLWKAGIGLAIGLIGALCLSHLMTDLLFEVKPYDPISYAAVSVLLLLIAWLASYLPARHAAGIVPMDALRWE
jgi:putative ABC transport system permease protein